MPFDPDLVRSWSVPIARQRLVERDVALYGLAVGAGLDPTDRRQLAFVSGPRPTPLAAMATTLAHPGFWMQDDATGIDWRRVVHGEQRMRLHRPLPTEPRDLVGTTRVIGTSDKGPGRGALVFQERVVRDAAGEPLATLGMTTFCRGDGGCGGPDDAPFEPLRRVPERPSDASVRLPTSRQSALLFSLFGDRNPLHTDPEVARGVGFERPILHGLATFGHACLALALATDHHGAEVGDPASMEARFSAPVLPGEELETRIWFEPDRLAFETRRVRDDVVTLAHGSATIAGSG
jgi:acyl dehydratase